MFCCRTTQSRSSWLKQSRLQQRLTTDKHAVKSRTMSGIRPPLSPAHLQEDMLWFCYSLTNAICRFQGWNQKTATTKINPKTLSCLQPAPNTAALLLHIDGISPALVSLWFPEMICRFYWLHLKIFTGCCSTTNPSLTSLLADPLRLFTHTDWESDRFLFSVNERRFFSPVPPAELQTLWRVLLQRKAQL